MTSLMSKACSVSISDVIFVRAASSWNSRYRLRLHWNASRPFADPSLILILSDINMPGMSGLEMLPKVRAERPNVPVIMITAYGDEDTKRRAIAQGAIGLLTKPIDFALLRHEIDARLDQAA
jgi:CheY-like chemotaxis protein